MREITGKRVFITGAGHGFGREMARTFAVAGAEVIVTDLDPDRVAATTEMLHSMDCKAYGYPMDVTDPESVLKIRDRLHADRGPIDILINNAGVVSGGAFLDVPLKQHLLTYQVNAIGPTIVTHAFLPDLISRPETNCVNISSASAMIPLPYATTYASSKWAVLGFSDSLREELRLAGHAHVGVTAICPSYIGTGMFSGVRAPRFMGMLPPAKLAGMVLKTVQRNREQLLTPWLVKLIPLGRCTLHRSLFRKLCDWLNVSTGMMSWDGSARQSTEDIPANRPAVAPRKREPRRRVSLHPWKEMSAGKQ